MCVWVCVPVCASGGQRSTLSVLPQEPATFFQKKDLFLFVCICGECECRLSEDVRSLEPGAVTHRPGALLASLKFVAVGAVPPLQPPPCFLTQGFSLDPESPACPSSPGPITTPTVLGLLALSPRLPLCWRSAAGPRVYTATTSRELSMCPKPRAIVPVVSPWTAFFLLKDGSCCSR